MIRAVTAPTRSLPGRMMVSSMRSRASGATLAPDALERMLETIIRPGNERVGAVTARIMLAGAFLARRAVPGEAIPAGSYRSGNLVLEPAALSSPASFRLVNSTGNIVTRGG